MRVSYVDLVGIKGRTVCDISDPGSSPAFIVRYNEARKKHTTFCGICIVYNDVVHKFVVAYQGMEETIDENIGKAGVAIVDVIRMSGEIVIKLGSTFPQQPQNILILDSVKDFCAGPLQK